MPGLFVIGTFPVSESHGALIDQGEAIDIDVYIFLLNRSNNGGLYCLEVAD